MPITIEARWEGVSAEALHVPCTIAAVAVDLTSGSPIFPAELHCSNDRVLRVPDLAADAWRFPAATARLAAEQSRAALGAGDLPATPTVPERSGAGATANLGATAASVPLTLRAPAATADESPGPSGQPLHPQAAPLLPADARVRADIETPEKAAPTSDHDGSGPARPSAAADAAQVDDAACAALLHSYQPAAQATPHASARPELITPQLHSCQLMDMGHSDALPRPPMIRGEPAADAAFWEALAASPASAPVQQAKSMGLPSLWRPGVRSVCNPMYELLDVVCDMQC